VVLLRTLLDVLLASSGMVLPALLNTPRGRRRELDSNHVVLGAMGCDQKKLC
jgi:hypothetical protein